MLLKRVYLASVLALAVMAFPVTGALAAGAAPFTQQAFDAAKTEGKPILIQIHASWCPVCAKQRPILSELEAQPEFKDLVVYNIDFDTQKDIVREMGAQKQSTLIVFHGTSERGRSTGETDPTAIKALLSKAKS